MAIEIHALTLPQDRMRFVNTWWTVYENDPHWVPPLRMDIKNFLDPRKNPYFKTADVQCWLATKDGKAVGTIAATVDHKLHEPEVGLFGFFEFIEDLEVARALFDAATAWLRSKGMKSARGPFNFNINHEFGLLVDPFDDDPCIANPHNAWYYPSFYEQLGMQVAKNWYAYWFKNDPVPDRWMRMHERFMSRHPEVTLRPMDVKNYDRDVDLFWELYNDAWSENWGHIEMTEAEFRFKAAGLKAVLDPELAFFVYVGDKMAGAVISLPDYNQVAKKMNGRLFPFGWWHFLMGRKKIDRGRILVLGIKQEFQQMPLGLPLYVRTWDVCLKKGYRGAEASLVLEDNSRMRGALEKLGAQIYKTYRTYELPLG